MHICRTVVECYFTMDINKFQGQFKADHIRLMHDEVFTNLANLLMLTNVFPMLSNQYRPVRVYIRRRFE